MTHNVISVKHAFKLLSSNDRVLNGNYEYYVFECDICWQLVRVHKEFFKWMVTTPTPMSDYYIKQITKDMVACNRQRNLITIGIPVVPKCTVCQKRYVFEPGSGGIGDLVCLPCYYDL